MPEFHTDSNVDLPATVEIPQLAGVTDEDVRAFFKAYATSLLWSATWNTDTGDAPEGYGNDNIELREDHLIGMAVYVLDFIQGSREDLIAYAAQLGWGSAGTDFALTRNRHGSGFWDRGLGELGHRLTVAAHPYGTEGVQAWVDEDGDVVAELHN